MLTGICVAVIQVDLTVDTRVTMGTQTLVDVIIAHTGGVVVAWGVRAHVLHLDLAQITMPTCITTLKYVVHNCMYMTISHIL